MHRSQTHHSPNVPNVLCIIHIERGWKKKQCINVIIKGKHVRHMLRRKLFHVSTHPVTSSQFFISIHFLVYFAHMLSVSSFNGSTYRAIFIYAIYTYKHIINRKLVARFHSYILLPPRLDPFDRRVKLNRICNQRCANNKIYLYRSKKPRIFASLIKLRTVYMHPLEFVPLHFGEDWEEACAYFGWLIETGEGWPGANKCNVL